MKIGLGPQSQRVYKALRENILSGQLAAGEQFPSQTKLATEFGVALMTIRQALNQLQAEGLVYAKQGLGTFVRGLIVLAILIVDDDSRVHEILSTYARHAGYRSLSATDPKEALAALESDPDIVLIFSNIRAPSKEAGIEFIQIVRQRWPEIPLVALTGYPGDLIELYNTPNFPLLILPKPIPTDQIELAFRLAPRLESRRRINETRLMTAVTI